MRLVLLLLLAAAPAVPQDIETFYRRLIKFDRKYEAMMHSVCGWPEKLEILEPVCRPADGHFDVKAYAEARSAAKELFGLAEVK